MSDITELTFTNPAGLHDPTSFAYSHLAQFPADWRIIMPAGQGPGSPTEPFADSFRAQFQEAWENVRIVLAAAGATLSDIAKATIYIVDHDAEKLAVFQEEMTKLFGDRFPAGTLVPVPALAVPGVLIEVDPIAVVPNR